MTEESTPVSTSNEAKPEKIPRSVTQAARQNNPEAIATMFHQFIPSDESIFFVEYLGIEGFFGLGAKSFACLTDKRVASLRLAPFGEMVYQDGYLEDINSGVIYQPSKLALYVLIFMILILAIGTFGLALLLLPVVGRLYYRFKKSGLVFWIKEGVAVYMFTNRKLLVRANNLYRDCSKLREERITKIKR